MQFSDSDCPYLLSSFSSLFLCCRNDGHALRATSGGLSCSTLEQITATSNEKLLKGHCPSWCNWTQVWLPAALKAHDQEASIKESDFIQVPATWKMGNSGLKAHFLGQCGTHVTTHLSISEQAGVLIRRDKENKENKGRGCGLQAVSSLVLIWIFIVSVLEQFGASQIPAVGWSVTRSCGHCHLSYKQKVELLAPAKCL